MLSLPFSSLMGQGPNCFVNDGAVRSLDILATRFEDRLPVRFFEGHMALFETPQADVPEFWLLFIVGKEVGERTYGAVEEVKVMLF